MGTIVMRHNDLYHRYDLVAIGLVDVGSKASVTDHCIVYHYGLIPSEDVTDNGDSIQLHLDQDKFYDFKTLHSFGNNTDLKCLVSNSASPSLSPETSTLQTQQSEPSSSDESTVIQELSQPILSHEFTKCAPESQSSNSQTSSPTPERSQSIELNFSQAQYQEVYPDTFTRNQFADLKRELSDVKNELKSMQTSLSQVLAVMKNFDVRQSALIAMSKSISSSTCDKSTGTDNPPVKKRRRRNRSRKKKQTTTNQSSNTR